MESGLHPAAAGQRPDAGRIQFRSSGGRPDLLPVISCAGSMALQLVRMSGEALFLKENAIYYAVCVFGQ